MKTRLLIEKLVNESVAVVTICESNKQSATFIDGQDNRNRFRANINLLCITAVLQRTGTSLIWTTSGCIYHLRQRGWIMYCICIFCVVVRHRL